jgi:hypothetical protein
LCRVNVCWRIEGGRQYAVIKHLLDTFSRIFNSRIRWHWKQGIVDRSNYPKLEHIRFIEASSSAVPIEYVSHASVFKLDFSGRCYRILIASGGNGPRRVEFDDSIVHESAVNNSAAVASRKSLASIIKISGGNIIADKGPRLKNCSIENAIEDAHSSVDIENTL